MAVIETVSDRTVVSGKRSIILAPAPGVREVQRAMGPFVTPTVARRLRVVGAAIVLLVLVTAPFERWFLVRRSNAMQERILDVRRAASARYPEKWQRDSVAVREVANLEYRRAHVRQRLMTQLTTQSWTVRLLAIGVALVVVGFVGERGEGRGTRR